MKLISHVASLTKQIGSKLNHYGWFKKEATSTNRSALDLDNLMYHPDIGGCIDAFNSCSNQASKYLYMEQLCNVCEENNETHPGVQLMAARVFSRMRDEERALKCINKLENMIDDLHGSDKSEVEMEIKSIKNYWEKEVPGRVKSMTKKRGKMSNDKFIHKWKKNVPITQYTFEKNKSEITKLIRNNWNNLKSINNEKVNDICYNLYSIKTGDIERVYSITNHIIAYILSGYNSEYWQSQMNEIDRMVLQDGDINDPKIIEMIINAQKNALTTLYDEIMSISKQTPNIDGFSSVINENIIKKSHQLNVEKWPFALVGKPGQKKTIYIRPGKYKIFHNSPTVHDNTSVDKNGKIFEYCPPNEVESEITEMIKMLDKQLSEINSNNSKIDDNIINIAAWLHHTYILIHPFQDGNGRVARLIVSLLFMHYGLPPLIVDMQDKPAYIAALDIADQKQDLAALATFFEHCLQSTIKDIGTLINIDFSKVDNIQIASQTLDQRNMNKKFGLIY